MCLCLCICLFVSICLRQCHHQMISFHKIIFKKKHFQEVSEQTSMNYVFLLRPESISSQHTPLATKTPAWNPSLDQVPRCSTFRCWTVRSCAPWPRWQQIRIWCIWAPCYWIGDWFTDLQISSRFNVYWRKSRLWKLFITSTCDIGRLWLRFTALSTGYQRYHSISHACLVNNIFKCTQNIKECACKNSFNVFDPSFRVWVWNHESIPLFPSVWYLQMTWRECFWYILDFDNVLCRLTFDSLYQRKIKSIPNLELDLCHSIHLHFSIHLHASSNFASTD